MIFIKHRSGVHIYFVLLCLLLWAETTEAGHITLMISNTTHVSGTRIQASLLIQNKGTETARDLTLTASCLEQQYDAVVADMIVPYQSTSAIIPFTLPRDYRGTFPVFISLSYADSSGRPHTAVLVAAAQTDEAQPSAASMSVTQEKSGESHRILVSVSDPSARLKEAAITFHGTDDTKTSHLKQYIQFNNGRASGVFDLVRNQHMRNLKDPRNAYVTAEYKLDNIHYLNTIRIVLAPEPSASVEVKTGTVGYPVWMMIAIILSICIPIAYLIYHRHRKPESLSPQFGAMEAPINNLLDVLVLVVIEGFILTHLTPDQLIRDTITTGGDTASHYYTLIYLQQQLLPQGKITGWTPGNYAGFPILQFYFPLPFLLMCGLNLLIPLTIAFKWITLLGTFLLPIAVYCMLRYMKNPFPGPAIGAALTLPFLFNPAHSAWGGNLLSTLSGEFSYSLSLALSVFFLGYLYRGCLEHNRIIRNALLVFLIGFSHGYTLLYVEAVSLFFLITPRGFIRRLTYLLKVYLLGFLLLAFWLLPLMIFTPYTTAYHSVWNIHSIREVISPVLLPVAVLGGCTSLGYVVAYVLSFRKENRYPMSAPGFIWFGMGAACVMYIIAPRLGVIDVRYLPIALLMTGIMGALGLGTALKRLRRWRMDCVVLIIILAVTCAWTARYAQRANGFARWDYEGFEAKAGWTLLNRISDYLSGSFQDPRVVFEHSSRHNFFGTTRVFESLPLFAGRATLEGLYMQASISAPFVFYIQSEISKEKSAPFKQYTVSDLDFEGARRHLRLFNVRELILRSKEAKKAIRSNAGYMHEKTFGLYEIWSLKEDDYPYVTPLKAEPVLYQTKDWKSDFYQWFINDDTRGIHLVYADREIPAEPSRFHLTAKSFKDLKYIPIDTRMATVKETIHHDEILIETNWIGKPLLIKMSYHPDWHVDGANKIYRVSPSFMLIYPEKEKVRVYYDRGSADWAGLGLTGLGLMILFFQHPLMRKLWSGPRSWINSRFPMKHRRIPFLSWDPPMGARRIMLLLGIMVSIFCIGAFAYETYYKDPDRMFNRFIQLKDQGQYDRARSGFASLMVQAPYASRLRSEAAYYIAICHYLEQNYSAALDAFKVLVERFPDGLRYAEGQYHIGLCYFRLKKEQEGIDQMRLVVDERPGTPWAEYAMTRLKEHHVTYKKNKPVR